MVARTILAAVMLAATALAAQEDQTVYFQLLGSAGTYSLNYERRIGPNFGPVAFTLSAGLSAFNNAAVYDAPILGRLLLGRRNQLEAGIGLEPELYHGAYGSEYQTLLIAALGYRHFFKHGFMLGLAFTPIVETRPWFIYPNIGINIGWRI